MENLFKAKPFSDDHYATIYDQVELINSANRPRILKLLVLWPVYLLLFMSVPLLITKIGAERFFDMGKQGTFDNYPTVVKLLLTLLAILILIFLILFSILQFLLIDMPLALLCWLNGVIIMVPYLAITKMVSSN